VRFDLEKGEKMKTNIVWNKEKAKKLFYFNELPLNCNFRIATTASQGAIYRKIYNELTGNYGAMEEYSGKVFKPTQSPVELVEVTITIDSAKPVIYD
jgi:hypothetical protein